MVWWHGGAFKEGSSFGPFDLYDAKHVVVAGEVVVVSRNYRLGALGALAHSAGLTGNYGFLDQRACLQWVKSEVRSFGGDPNRVTLWGQSAGAQSAYLHMVSPGSQGLFHGAVLESAPALSLMESKEAKRLGAVVAHKVGCRNHSDADVVRCLQEVDVDRLYHASAESESDVLAILETFEHRHITASILPFKPNIDGVDILEQPFRTLLKGPTAAGVPILAGSNHDEMYALLDSLPHWVRGLEVEAMLGLIFGWTVGQEAWEYYKPLYPGDELSAVVKLLTDYIFTCANQAAAAALPPPSYIYQFNRVASYAAKLFGAFGHPKCETHACHMEELPLTFNNTGPAALNVTLDSVELAMSRQLIGAITAFAHGRSPGWAPFSNSNRTGLVLNASAEVRPLGPAAEVCVRIWDKTGYQN